MSLVIVKAPDGTYCASQEFTWDVTNPITRTKPGEQSSAEGQTVPLQLQASDAALALPPGGHAADLALRVGHLSSAVMATQKGAAGPSAAVTT